MTPDASVANEWLFDVASDETRAPKDGGFRALMAAYKEHGPLVPQSMLATALGVSRARVSQFIAEGRFKVVEVGGHKFVPSASLEEFLAVERKSGRPVHQPKLVDLVKSGVKAVREK